MTTRRELLRRRAGLLIGAALVLVFSVTLFQGANRNARALRESLMPTVLGLADAERALMEANSAAVTNLTGTAVGLTGPGRDYGAGIARAGHNLDQVTAPDETSIQTLALVRSMIGVYDDRIRDAQVAFMNDNRILGLAEIRYASDYLWMDDGVIAQLKKLDARASARLTRAEKSVWNTTGSLLFWVLTAGALLAGVLATQLYLSRRFRRTLNPALIAATGLGLVVVVMGPVLALRAEGHIREAVQDLRRTRSSEMDFSDRARTVGEQQLYTQVQQLCPVSSGAGCTHAARQYRIPPLGEPVHFKRSAGSLSRQFGRAAEIDIGLLLGAGGAAITIGLLAWTGLWRRIDEYGYTA